MSLSSLPTSVFFLKYVPPHYNFLLYLRLKKALVDCIKTTAHSSTLIPWGHQGTALALVQRIQDTNVQIPIPPVISSMIVYVFCL